jgi:hypothetical protein
LLHRTAQQNEAPPAEFYCSLEEGIPERVAPAVFGIPQRREFPGEQSVWFLLQRYSKYAEHPRKPVFCSGGILFTQSTTWMFCSAGNPPRRGNPGLKCTRIVRTSDLSNNTIYSLPQSRETIPLKKTYISDIMRLKKLFQHHQNFRDLAISWAKMKYSGITF